MSRLAGFSFGAVYSNRFEQVSPRGVFGLVLNVLPQSATHVGLSWMLLYQELHINHWISVKHVHFTSLDKQTT